LNAHSILDNPSEILTIDTTDMGQRISDTPGMLNSAISQYDKNDLFPSFKPRDIILGGMGGSAIAGNLVVDYLANDLNIPICVCRYPELPYTPTENTLVLINSFSGNTEETISMFHQARSTPCKTIVISNGGTLSHLAPKYGIPLVNMSIQGEPRTIVPYHLFLLIQILQPYTTGSNIDNDLLETIDVAKVYSKEFSISNPSAKNPSKRLAESIKNRLLCVYGGGLLSSLTLRWKTQINENGKSLCISDTIPELFHNTLETFQEFEKINKDIFVILLQQNQQPQWLRSRYTTIKQLLNRFDIKNVTITTNETSDLAQIIHMMMLCDFTSYYLGILKQANPSPNKVIDEAKKMMS